MKKRRAERRRGSAYAAYHGRGMAPGEWIPLLFSGIFAAAALLCAFALRGVRFSALLFGALAAVCVLAAVLERWAAVSRAGWICQIICRTLLAAVVVAFALTETLIIRDGERQPTRTPDAVIVLGAGVNGRTPSLALQSRIDAAEAYLKQYPAVPAILSGGRGRGEDITEARAMYDALTARGIDADRLTLEEESTSTAENFQNSKALLKEQGFDLLHAQVAVVTNDFHVFRARAVGESLGLNTFGVPAELPWWWLSANYYVREFFAVGKQAVTRLAG